MDLTAPFPDSLAFSTALKRAREVYGRDIRVQNQTCGEYARLLMIIDQATKPYEPEVRLDPETLAVAKENYALRQRHEKARIELQHLTREAAHNPAVPGLDRALLAVPPPLTPTDGKPFPSVSSARAATQDTLARVLEIEGQLSNLNSTLLEWRQMSPRERAIERRFQALEQAHAQLRDDLAALKNSVGAARSHGAVPRKQRAGVARSGMKTGAAAVGSSFREQREALNASIAAARARKEAR
jgi:hypothetical protein